MGVLPLRDLSFFSKIYVCTESVDFRKQAHGLSLLVEHKLNQKPMTERALFVFTNKRRNAVKILYWDATGFALWWKSLECERFSWPKSNNEAHQIDAKDLRMLLDGVDLSKIKKHRKVILS
jgi:transposase